jgi:hypothetical protein
LGVPWVPPNYHLRLFGQAGAIGIGILLQELLGDEALLGIGFQRGKAINGVI